MPRSRRVSTRTPRIARGARAPRTWPPRRARRRGARPGGDPTGSPPHAIASGRFALDSLLLARPGAEALQQVSDMPARAADELGDLVVRHFVDVAVDRDLREVGRRAEQDLAHDGETLGARRSALPLGGREVPLEEPRPVLSVADPVQTGVQGRAVEPGRDPRSAGVLRGLVEERDEDLLHQLTGFLLVAQQGARTPQHDVTVTAVDRLDV